MAPEERGNELNQFAKLQQKAELRAKRQAEAEEAAAAAAPTVTSFPHERYNNGVPVLPPGGMLGPAVSNRMGSAPFFDRGGGTGPNL